ncbi:Protein NLRC3 [Gigaspora margarita]|uniref:Protein NLRC3 n=1 Tax=Gigaspora margarita TaxID=4874 RepID=A0A8H4A994_GIGMA|nr:Protein NLRC3 [Gigaspora margarita]
MLNTLGLYLNQLGSEGGEAIANVLHKNNSLTELELSHNNLGYLGGNVLINALCNNKTLTSIDISSNKLGSDIGETHFRYLLYNLGLEGGKALASALCKNKGLKSLDLSYNKLKNNVGKELVEVFHMNTTLSTLKFNRNEFNPEIEKQLEENIKSDSLDIEFDSDNDSIVTIC